LLVSKLFAGMEQEGGNPGGASQLVPPGLSEAAQEGYRLPSTASRGRMFFTS